MPWQQFSSLLVDVFRETSANVAKLESLIGTLLSSSFTSSFVLMCCCAGRTGQVKKVEWTYLTQWFSPLVVVTNQQEAPLGYTFSEMVEIVSASWFFIDVPKDKIRTVLTESGSFLIRFSSKGFGVYTLSAMNIDKQIGHWRINCIKTETALPPVFRMQDITFSSLQDIVRTYSEAPLHSAEDPDFKRVLLQNPADRTKHAF